MQRWNVDVINHVPHWKIVSLSCVSRYGRTCTCMSQYAHTYKYNARLWKMAACTYGCTTEGVLDLHNKAKTPQNFWPSLPVEYMILISRWTDAPEVRCDLTDTQTDRHTNPTTVTLAAHARQELVMWACGCLLFYIFISRPNDFNTVGNLCNNQLHINVSLLSSVLCRRWDVFWHLQDEIDRWCLVWGGRKGTSKPWCNNDWLTHSMCLNTVLCPLKH